MTSNALVLRTDDEVFTLAERISRVSIVPAAYRGKPGDCAVAILYGQELGLAPMTALNRIVVIEGKPTLDAQGMTAVIRQAGHSIAGKASGDGATVTGTRGDNGDSMTVTFTMADARQAGLANKSNWKAYPADMCWARAVSRLGRELFSDCLLGFSYVPEEADFTGTTEFSNGAVAPQPAAVEAAPTTTTRVSPVAAPVTDDEPEEAEVVETGELASDAQVKKLIVLFNAAQIKGRDTRLAWCAARIGREIGSSKELTKDEASLIIDLLERSLDGDPEAPAPPADDIAEAEIIDEPMTPEMTQKFFDALDVAGVPENETDSFISAAIDQQYDGTRPLLASELSLVLGAVDARLTATDD